MYKKSDIVELTRIADPKEWRSAEYFMADDGIDGPVLLEKRIYRDRH